MKIAIFAAIIGLVIVATQIECTLWLDHRRAADLDSIHYDMGYVRLAIDDWENGKRVLTCKQP